MNPAKEADLLWMLFKDLDERSSSELIDVLIRHLRGVIKALEEMRQRSLK